MHMTDLGKQRAADGGHLLAALGNGEACVPHNHSSTSPAEKQAAISKRLASDYTRAQVLAAHHIALAERFVSEAEALKDLLRESEALT